MEAKRTIGEAGQPLWNATDMLATRSATFVENTPPRSFAGVVGASVRLFPLVVASRLINLAKFVVIARAFGASASMDAFWIAWNIPGGLGGLAEGACEHAFVVIGSRAETHKPGSAWSLLARFLFLSFLAFSLLTVFYLATANAIIEWMAPGFSPESRRGAAHLTRLLSPILFLSPVFGLLTGFHYLHRRYSTRTLAPAAASLAIILIVVLAASSWGIPTLGCAYTVSLLLQIVIVVPLFQRLRRARTKPLYSFSYYGQEMLGLMTPMLFVTAATNTNLIVDRFVASSLGTGAISHLDYATKIGTLFYDLAVGGLLVTFYPFMAEQVISLSRTDVARQMGKALRATALLIVPSIGFAAFLRFPLLRLLLERGAYTHADTLATAQAFLAYAPGFVFLALTMVLVRGFYSCNDALTPMLLFCMSILPNWLLDIAFARHLGFVGIALSSSVVYALDFAILATLFQRKHLRLEMRAIGAAIAKMLVSLAITVSAIRFLLGFRLGELGNFLEHSGLPIVAFSGFLCFGLYFLGLRLLHLREAEALLPFVKMFLTSRSRTDSL